MAIKKTVTYKGIEVRDAYLKVWSFEGSKDALCVNLGVYVRQGEEMLDSKQFHVPYNMDGENPIKQAYEFIKAMSEFEDAEDC